MEVLSPQYAQATVNLVTMLKQHVMHRFDFFEERIEALERDSYKNQAKELSALKALRRAETKSKLFWRIRLALQPRQTTGVTRLDIPADMAPFSDGQHNFSR